MVRIFFLCIHLYLNISLGVSGDQSLSSRYPIDHTVCQVSEIEISDIVVPGVVSLITFIWVCNCHSMDIFSPKSCQDLANLITNMWFALRQLSLNSDQHEDNDFVKGINGTSFKSQLNYDQRNYDNLCIFLLNSEKKFSIPWTFSCIINQLSPRWRCIASFTSLVGIWNTSCFEAFMTGWMINCDKDLLNCLLICRLVKWIKWYYPKRRYSISIVASKFSGGRHFNKNLAVVIYVSKIGRNTLTNDFFLMLIRLLSWPLHALFMIFPFKTLKRKGEIVSTNLQIRILPQLFPTLVPPA